MFKKWLRNQSGSAGIEYALIAAGIALALAAGLPVVEQRLEAAFNVIANF